MKHRQMGCVGISAAGIRSASASDLDSVAKLYNDNFREHIMVHRGILNNPEYLAKRIANPEERWMVSEKDGEIVGVAALAIAPPVGSGEIERVCVARQFRGNGIAYDLCQRLVEEARHEDLGFVEAFARGDQGAMQRTFQKLGFKVYGIGPRYEVVHAGRIVREQFVCMGLLLKPDSVDEENLDLVPKAREILEFIQKSQE